MRNDICFSSKKIGNFEFCYNYRPPAFRVFIEGDPSYFIKVTMPNGKEYVYSFMESSWLWVVEYIKEENRRGKPILDLVRKYAEDYYPIELLICADFVIRKYKQENQKIVDVSSFDLAEENKDKLREVVRDQTWHKEVSVVSEKGFITKVIFENT